MSPAAFDALLERRDIERARLDLYFGTVSACIVNQYRATGHPPLTASDFFGRKPAAPKAQTPDEMKSILLSAIKRS